MEKFHVWLSEELDRRNMSQADLARACRVSTAHISRIVSGERNVGTKALTNFAQALNLPVDFVFEKAGFLPPTSDLSPTQRTLIDLAKDLPDNDVELAVVLLEKLKTRRDTKTFGSLVLDDLAQHGISQADIERACGITSEQLSLIMSEEHPFCLPLDFVAKELEKPEFVLPSAEQVIELFKSYAAIPDSIQEYHVQRNPI
jgi:transcriptional regulator with XRE-family HTH domain